MADLKMSELNLSAAADGDELIINRAGVNFKVTRLSVVNIPRIITFVLEKPKTGSSGIMQHKFPTNVTILRVSASCDVGGTCTIQLDERAEATPNTGGTDVLTAPLVADDTIKATTSFANAGIAANAPLNLDIDDTKGSPKIVRVHVEFKLA